MSIQLSSVLYCGTLSWKTQPCNRWNKHFEHAVALRWPCPCAACELDIIISLVNYYYALVKWVMAEWSIVSKNVHENTKRRILPLENHSSKHSRERGGSERGWEERREKGQEEGKRRERKREEEEKEGNSGRVWKTATGASATNKLKRTSSYPSFNSKSLSHRVTWSCDSCRTLTFALSRAKAAAFVGGGRSLVEGRGLSEAFTAGDFTVNMIGQIPQEADTVLHQLQEERGGHKTMKHRDEQKTVSWAVRSKRIEDKISVWSE